MWTYKMRKTVLTAVAVVALLLIGASAASAQVPAQGGPDVGSSGGGFGDEMNESSAADSVYVRDDGSGVLVYNGSGDGNASVRYGADAETGLFHLTANGTGGEGFEGNMSFEAEPAYWLLNGSFTAAETGMLENMNLDVESTTNSEESSLDAGLDATVSSSLAALAPTASTTGEVVVEPDRITSSGNISYQAALSGSSTREVRRFDLTENEGGYVLEARERRIVRGDIVAQADEPFSESEEDFANENGTFEPPEPERTDPAEDWGTRERARETLGESYTGFAENVSGTASLTLESYSFENVTVGEGAAATEESLIDVTYTVEYTGIKEAIAQNVSEELSGNVSEETAEGVADGLRNLTVNRLAFATVSDEDGTSANWTVDVENYNDVTKSFLRLSSEMQPTGAEGMEGGAANPFFSEGYFDEVINRSESQMEAAEAAGLVTQWEWSGSLDTEGGSMGGGAGAGGFGGAQGATATVNADITKTTENWGSYVEELESRDIPIANTSLDLTASTTDAGVEGDVRWEADGEGISEGYQTTMEAYESALRGSDEIDASFIENLNRSGFRRAQMDASVGENGWNVEAGAAFSNGSALSAAVESVTGYGFTQVVGTTEEGATTTYVKSDSLVDEPTEEAVRSLDGVDDETAVNLPGEWDRDFPEMDTEAASNYLGVSEDDGSPLPGFGAVVALVALVAVAVGVGRRDS